MSNFSVLRTGILISVIGSVVACGGKAAVLPETGPTLLELYQSHMGSAGGEAMLEARLALRRPMVDEVTDVEAYTRSAENEIHALFVRLPNPDLVMYVFPHLATEDEVPIPGYSTVFPLYERVVYALPGEVP